ncbi:hypothetical protein CCMA1212_006866 [Trichoderma ghanense]|uniref:Uncharacterized protein n=1 Tax=Trichoderma ghanense TaxID=65468 RepID=A0ABY2GZZ2_9HYPO
MARSCSIFASLGYTGPPKPRSRHRKTWGPPGCSLDGFRHRTTATFLHRHSSETVDPDTTSPPVSRAAQPAYVTAAIPFTPSPALVCLLCGNPPPPFPSTIHLIPRIVVPHGQATMRTIRPRTRSARQMRLRHITFPRHDLLRHSKLPTSTLKGQ